MIDLESKDIGMYQESQAKTPNRNIHFNIEMVIEAGAKYNWV